MNATTDKITISSETLNILKNFATINSNLHVKPGQTINTISPSMTILAEAKVAEDFDTEFGIWDMAKFLSTVSLFKDPEFSFEDTHVTISSSDSKASVKYFFSDPQLLTKVDKKINMPKEFVSFNLSQADLLSILRAASVLQAPDMCIESCDEGICIRVCDKKDPTAHSWSLTVGENKKELTFQFWFKMENLKMIPANYKVDLAEKRVARFTGENLSITYWVSMESDSTTSKG
jgi:hypothetical protein